MKQSFPPIKTPIGLLPSCVEIEDVPLRLAVIEFDYGPTNVGYVLEEKKERLHPKLCMKIESIIVNQLGTRVRFWSNSDVESVTKNYRIATEWKWK